ncbi:DNA polymerase III subunit beta [Enterovibrio norvegicus]|uniref:DNA polymerase III subunit beta n=1 Tax=Enterovibrio norvegicus TaxID=188144 RepID=UPI000C84BB85|nr:DNA polymerase III subunit beta [Enterovibrio norvegicus]PMH64463.1 DNA polymerase III subunit beta [Enterovibrio norvegicus]
MKATFNASDLLGAIEFMAIADKNLADLQYVDQVYVKVENNVCQLFRYGPSITKVSPRVSCECDTDFFEWQINFEAFQAIVRKIKTRFNTVDLSFDAAGGSKVVMLEAGKLKTKLNVTDFKAPIEPELNNLKEICVVQSELERIIKRAKVASAKQDSRHALNGVSLTTNESGELRAVGCDGHRLAVANCLYLAHIYQVHELILSNTGVRYLESLFKLSEEENLVLHFDDSHLSISLSNGARVKMQIVADKYPDWRKVVPLSFRTKVRVNRVELITSIQSAAPLSTEKFRTAVFGMSPKGIAVSTNSDVGDFSDEVEIVSFDGDDITVGFNLDYLLAALTILDCEEVDLELNDMNSGIILKETVEANGIQLLMPVRT